MTQEEIIKLAEQAGLPEFENNESQASNLVAFAKLVAAKEREACAKVCEQWDASHPQRIAAAIRARGQA